MKSILESKNEAGGFSSTLSLNGAIFDYGGHSFHTPHPEIKDLVFTKTDFNINKDDTLFFEKLLKTEPNENKIILKNSNIFFRGSDESDHLIPPFRLILLNFHTFGMSRMLFYLMNLMVFL